MIEILVAAGANIDAHAEGRTPLFFAIENGREEALQKLLDLGADPNEMKPLLLAAVKEDGATFVRRLLAAGADPNDSDIDGVTPLMAASEFGNVATVQLLLEANANPAAQSKEGNTALDMARKSDMSNERVIELLSTYGNR